MVPLLPFEKDLIKTLGWSEDEYRYFSTRAAFKGRRRPAGYEHIPDIENDAMTIAIVSLAVGIISTAVSVLMQPDIPEPETPEQQRRGNNTRLGDWSGRSRFGTTSGFSSQAQLAEYATPIAVVFARHEEEIGGILASPQLVWSRTLSYGREQAAKLMFVVGEAGLGGGIERPDLAGIYLGTTPLDATEGSKFAFYWNRNSHVNGRMQAANYAYGSRASGAAGDTQDNNDIYLLPTASGKQPWFSGSYSPTSNNIFGCYAPMANGTGYRVNYQLMPLPNPPGEADDRHSDQDRNWAIKMGRGKVTGFWGYLNGGDLENAKFNKYMRDLGQKGTGREYSRFMGVTHYNGENFTGDPDDNRRVVTAAVGDTIVFSIAGGFIAETYYKNEQDEIVAPVDDINNATIRMRQEADNALQLGTKVMIGKTLWVVQGRSLPIWGQEEIGPFQERGSQQINLTCVETFDSSSDIGYVSQNMVYNYAVRTDDQGQNTYNYGDTYRQGLTAGPGFFPLMLAELATIRNTRPCITTEVGLRSQVWNRASGLCNFSALPTANVIRDAERDMDSLQSGTMNTYFTRTSVFTVQVRPAGAAPGGDAFAWESLPEQFCVQGNAPVDQYNFLRINHPEEKEYEFRFIPKNGGDVAQNMPDERQLWLLDGRINSTSMTGARLQGTYVTPYGMFTIQALGRTVVKSEIEFCPEMATDPEVTTVVVTVNAPQQVAIDEYWPAPEATETSSSPTAVRIDDYLPIGESQYKQSALMYELFGQASSDGLTKTKTVQHTSLTYNRSLTIKYTGVVNTAFELTNPLYPGYRAFTITNVEVVGSTGDWDVGESQNCPIATTANNPRNPEDYATVGCRFTITQTSDSAPLGGREGAFEYQMLGNPDDVSLGTAKGIYFDVVGPTGSTAQLQFAGTTATASEAYQQKWGLTTAWETTSFQGVPGSTAGDWAVGQQILYTVDVSGDNPFREGLSEVGVRLQLSSVVTEAEVPGLRSDRVFEENAQITELSNYTERETSAANGPEHSITYVNEFVMEEPVPQYDRLTLAGLALRASRTFSSLDQMRYWLANGVPVQRFHPSELGTIGPSNMFPDLIYFLLTDEKAGIGRIFAEDLVDTDSFTRSCTFLKTNKIFYNGAIADKVNLRSYTAETAPQLLLNFVISNGKIGLEPAVPTTAAGQISSGPTPIKAVFTSGNIIEDSYELQYLPAESRRNVITNIRWRKETPNKFPEEQTLTLRWNEAGSDTYPMETLDLTGFCCSKEHAKLVAILQLSLRRHTTHSITFKTTPYGLDLSPGDYIRVDTISAPYQSGNNGVVGSDGAIVSAFPFDDMVYPVFYYRRDMEDVMEGDMQVMDGYAVDAIFFDSVFSLQYQEQGRGIYQVIELTLEEDGLVSIKATEHPVTSSGASLIGDNLLNQSSFIEDY